MVALVDFLSSAVKDKPIDCSDIENLDNALAELSKLRRIIIRVCKVLQKANIPGQTVQDSGPQRRHSLDNAKQPPSGDRVQVTTDDVERRPSAGSVERRPSKDVAQRRPSEDVVQRRPSEDIVQRRPSEDVVQRLPSDDIVQRRPSDGIVQRRPSDDIVQRRPSEKPGLTEKDKKKKHRHALKSDSSFRKYEKSLVPKSSKDRELIKTAIQKSSLFCNCSEEELEDFVDVFSEKRVDSRCTVIKQGDEGDTFYVVKSGSLDIFLNVPGGNGKEARVGVPYERGSSFGELALIYESPRSATIRSSSPSVLWEITRTAYKGLHLQHQEKAHKLKLKELSLVKIGEQMLGDSLSDSELESMALATNYQSFTKGDVIVREGEVGDEFYIITKGVVDVYKKETGSKIVASLGVNSFFGEKALLSSDTRAATCVASSDVQCLTLRRDEFVLMLGNLEDLLSGNRSGKRSAGMRGNLKRSESMKVEQSARRIPSRRQNHKLSQSLTVGTFNRQALPLSQININDLEIRGVLGKGAFGKVSLVKNPADGKLFALKAIGKAFVVKTGQQKNIVSEFEIMRELDHPFVVKCHQVSQDKRYVYLLLSLLPGGELMDVLDEFRQFPEKWTRFYAASVVLAFHHMHEKNIIYRDLKPENLILDADGYCSLVDFGIAKKMSVGKTWTFCGTPDYLAPEIIQGQGHDRGVDYWGVGILLYELTYGYPPFYSNDPSNTTKKIIRGSYPTPQKFSPQLRDLLSKLLVGQSKRLGRTKGGIGALENHVWFSGFDWQAMLSRSLNAPWKPELDNLEDIGSNELDDDDSIDELSCDAPESDWNPVFGSRNVAAGYMVQF